MTILKELIPPFVYERVASLYRNLNKNNFIYWEGDYKSWDEASALCKGYDASEVFEKVKSASLAVKNGNAVFERDGVLFYHEEYSWELLACLFKIATEFKGRLSVLDFGGSLGSTYFQQKKIVTGLFPLTWCIVEQKQFVEFGKAGLEDDVLKFEYTVEDALEKNDSNVLLLGSVLQYLQDPYTWLKKFRDKKIPYMLIDRTPFIQGSVDRLTVQHVPERIYKATYPGWFFSEQKFMETILKDYSLIASYTLQDKSNIRAEFKGLFLKLN